MLNRIILMSTALSLAMGWMASEASAFGKRYPVPYYPVVPAYAVPVYAVPAYAPPAYAVPAYYPPAYYPPAYYPGTPAAPQYPLAYGSSIYPSQSYAPPPPPQIIIIYANKGDDRKEKFTKFPLTIDAKDIAPESEFSLLSVASFKSKWKVPFSDTGKVEFFLADGKSKRVPCVRDDITIRVAGEKTTMRAASIPFEGDRYDFVVLLPGEKVDIAEARKLLVDAPRLDATLAMVDLQPARSYALTLPTLDLQHRIDLVSVYEKAGITTLSDPKKLSFGSAFESKPEKGYRFQASQTAFLHLDQYGITAGAVQIDSAGSVGINQYNFKVNRSFCFLIRDRLQGTILFTGVVIDPQP